MQFCSNEIHSSFIPESCIDLHLFQGGHTPSLRYHQFHVQSHSGGKSFPTKDLNFSNPWKWVPGGLLLCSPKQVSQAIAPREASPGDGWAGHSDITTQGSKCFFLLGSWTSGISPQRDIFLHFLNQSFYYVFFLSAWSIWEFSQYRRTSPSLLTFRPFL